MSRAVLWRKGIGYAITFGLIVTPIRLAQAGWNVSVNAATGVGSAWANVTPPAASGKTLTTPSVSLPSVSLSNSLASGFKYTGTLPTGANSASYAQAKALSGLVFQQHCSLKGVTGDGTDNTNITSLVNITAGDCTTLTMESSTYLSNDMVSGTIVVDAAGTPGTGLLLRGYELAGPPPTNSDGSINLDQLATEGALKFSLLLVGPFDLSTTNCNAIVIPFTTQTGYTNLYFISDGVSKSNPLTVTCPGGVITNSCSNAVYPPVQVTGGCGGTTVTYNPPASALIGGVTNTVTVTATDQAGNATNCTFYVYRTPDTFSGFFSPIGGSGGSCASPFVIIKQSTVNKNLPVKFNDFCNGATPAGPNPTMSIYDCAGNLVTSGVFSQQSSVWHFNWAASSVPLGTYQLVATLQDGSQQFVWVELD